MTQDDARQQLIGLVKDEIINNEKAQFWVTNKVAFNMRELIKTFRKNYWGIYDNPFDDVTGKEKVWPPLTRVLCDAVRKGVDKDPKDIRFRAKRPRITDITHVTRGYVREWFSDNYLNHDLDQLTTTITIDGTQVWKTYWDGENIVRKSVDLLNVFIDPTSDSIQSAYRFTERTLLDKGEVASMDWENTADFKVDSDLEREHDNQSTRSGLYGDVYECWGKFPKKLIKAASGEDYDEDDESEMEGHVIISGIDTGHVLFHLAEENKNKDKNGKVIKPYEECWYLKIPGCWYGVSIAWTVMPLQYWLNTIVNLRINKNTIAQLGLLKIRKGSGVTQQMLKSLIAHGVIELNDPQLDLEQLQMAESGQSSYEDEKSAKQWAQEVTSVFDVNLGDMAASTSATGAVLQDRQSNTAMTLVSESIEHFVQRWMDRHVLPHIPKLIKRKGYVTLFKEFDDLKLIRQRVVANIAMEKLNGMLERGQFPTETNLQQELNRAERALESDGDLFIKVMDEIMAESMDTEVFMTSAEIDVTVTVNNLMQLRTGLPPEAQAELTAEALDLMGIQVPSSLRNPMQGQPGQPMQPGQVPGSLGMPAPTEQGLVTDANTMQNAPV
jgi:hypothetical protein